MDNCKKHYFSILLLSLLAIVPYLNTLNNGFVYDDKPTIVNNTLIKELHNLPTLFDKEDYFDLSGEMTYRPVVTFSYFIDYSMFGVKPWGYHLTNIVLHVINGALLYIFLTLLFYPPMVTNERLLTNHPLLISLLFVTHPVLTEAINTISFREDLLVFLFYLATLNIYILLRQNLTSHKSLSINLLYLLSCITYLLALFSKEMAATLPLIIYCYEWVLRDKKKERSASRWPNYYNVGYILITTIYIYLRFSYFHNPVDNQVSAWGMTEKLLSVPLSIYNYLKLTILPFSLSPTYELMQIENVFSPLFLLPFIAIVLFVILIYMTRKWESLFGVLFFLVTLLPVCNIIPILTPIPLAERFLYLPTVGFTIVLGHIILEAKNPKRIPSLYFSLLFFLVISMYASLTVMRNKVWHDDYDLWSTTVKKLPDNSFAHYCLGIEYQAQGKFVEAEHEYQIALKLKPYFVEAHNNLGTVYEKQGRLEDAVRQYQTILRVMPYNLKTRINLANVYTKTGLVEEAIQELKTVLRLEPNNPQWHHELGLAYASQGRVNEAAQEFQSTIRLAPALAEGHHNLGVAYSNMGLRDKAKTEFETALKLRPDFLPARQALKTLD